ncbi:hypothetical protein [Gimesia sp.]|uniref:hypothetical protein n=1 Tax=Gimesia sp. TaxID=2024833 RepID=UPI003A8F4FEE
MKMTTLGELKETGRCKLESVIRIICPQEDGTLFEFHASCCGSEQQSDDMLNTIRKIVIHGDGERKVKPVSSAERDHVSTLISENPQLKILFCGVIQCPNKTLLFPATKCWVIRRKDGSIYQIHPAYCEAFAYKCFAELYNSE